eukprot:4912426-Amphidinium_carterae.1
MASSARPSEGGVTEAEQDLLIFVLGCPTFVWATKVADSVALNYITASACNTKSSNVRMNNGGTCPLLVTA